jgi:hypothetical protein
MLTTVVVSDMVHNLCPQMYKSGYIPTCQLSWQSNEHETADACEGQKQTNPSTGDKRTVAHNLEAAVHYSYTHSPRTSTHLQNTA